MPAINYKQIGIINRLHTEIFGVPGQGTPVDKLEHILERKKLSEVFDPNDITLLHPDVAGFHYKDLFGDIYSHPYLRRLTAKRDLDRFNEYLEILENNNLAFNSFFDLLNSLTANESSIPFFVSVLDHPYWDRHHEQLKRIVGSLSQDSDFRNIISERIDFLPLNESRLPVKIGKPLTVETITTLARDAHQTGNFDPLKKALRTISFQGERLTNRVLTDVNAAYHDVRGTFWEVREFVNAITPGTYPYPVLKRDPVPLLSKEGFKRIWDEVRGAKPKSEVPILDKADQYKLAMSKTFGNIKKIDTAISSLYALNRLGNGQGDVLRKTKDAITTFLESEEGKSILADDVIMGDVLQSEQSRLSKAGLALEYVSSFTEGMARRLIPLGETLASTMDGITVTMTLQTARVTVEHEGYRDNFFKTISAMADASNFITADLAARAPLLNNTGATLAADLIEDANNFNAVVKDWRKRLRDSNDPTVPLTPAPAAELGGGPT